MSISPKVILEELFSTTPDHKRSLVAQAMGGRETGPPKHGLRWRKDGGFTYVSLESLDDFRGLLASDVQAVFRSRFGSDLTQAECLLLMRLMSGETLSQICKLDGVAYGTRRNQLASLREKAGLSRQTELVSTMSILCSSHLATAIGEPTGSVQAIRDMYCHYYPSGFRIHQPVLSSGREILVVDAGPIDGRPIICMHPTSVPVFPGPGEGNSLADWGVRTLTVLRPGYYKVRSSSADPRLTIQSFASDIAEFIRVMGIEEIPVISHCYGAAAGLAVCRTLGTRCQFHVMAAPRLPPRSDRGPWGIPRAWRSVLLHHPLMIENVVTAFSRVITNGTIFIKGLERAYRGFESDLEQLKYLRNENWFRDSLSYMARHNAGGLIGDYRAQLTFMLQDFNDLNCGVHIIASADDPLSNIEDWAPELAAAGVMLEIVPGRARYHWATDSQRLFELAMQ